MAPVSDSGENSRSNNDAEKDKRGTWGSQIDYLLSLIGYSVGPSNVLRFQYLCNVNGGGAFVIPYIACMMLCGLPVFFLEAAFGQFHGKSAAHVWNVCPLMKGLGIGMLIMSGGSTVYLTVNCAWMTYYSLVSCNTVLPWSECGKSWNTESCVRRVKVLSPRFTEHNVSSLLLHNGTREFGEGVWLRNDTLSHTSAEEFWQYKVLGISSGLDQLGSIKWELALCLFASYLVIFGCIVKGVVTIGKVVYVTATLPYVFLSVLLIRILTLPGGLYGAQVFITPDFSKLLQIQVWLEACVQVFFSLGPAWGGIISMASFNPFHANCLRNSIICTMVCGGTSIFAGVVTFSVLGFIAHEADVPITDVLSSGPGLGFVVYPEALAQLPFPQVWSFMFFILLFILTLDSLFAMVETVISAILDEYPFLMKWRMSVNAVFCAVSFLIGLIFVTEGGMYVFQLVDWYFGIIILILGGLLECIILAWIYGVDRVSADIELMLGRPAPLFFRITWSYITPAILLTIFIFTLVQYQPPTYGRYVYPDFSASVGWCLAAIPCIPLVVMMFVAIYREEGSIVQRLKKSLKPNSSWGPAKRVIRASYMNRHGMD
ncbi:sodium- and chloride-dependent glycine transporter 1-like [Haliotis asinina]|uniref:sodium- and chloride-dependent glycine transporter 1-like n=1 Tax=Haliotis asinina TaxID=109174 RepID=UPI003531C207